jgi:Skp family chaperone for outer membrane proteins
MTHSFPRARAGLAVAALAFALAGLTQTVRAGPPNPPPQGVPQPKILVIDRKAILQRSAVGQSIGKQAQAYLLQARSQLQGQAAALKAQGQTLQQQLAILSAEVKAKKIRDLESQQASLQQKWQQKQGLVEGGVFQAQTQMEGALGPILKGIMLERGANMLLDRNAVIFSTVDVDVTQTVIQRLNQKMPTLKVNLVPLPPGVQQQQQQAQQQ